MTKVINICCDIQEFKVLLVSGKQRKIKSFEFDGDIYTDTIKGYSLLIKSLLTIKKKDYTLHIYTDNENIFNHLSGIKEVKPLHLVCIHGTTLSLLSAFKGFKIELITKATVTKLMNSNTES